jgi:hypothetical protein
MPHPFAEWLTHQQTAAQRHHLHRLSENPGERDAMAGELHQLVRDHYMAPEIVANRIALLGAPETAALLRDTLPKTAIARSGDIGEVIATEVAEHYLEYTIPIRKLRHKESRNMAMRGDDVLGIKTNAEGGLNFLKGESKSRQVLNDAVVEEAATALDRDQGRPGRLSVLFVATRLREQNNHELAAELEKALVDSFAHNVVEHLICVVSGNDPQVPLASHLTACESERVRHAIGLRIEDHGEFIESIYEALNA